MSADVLKRGDHLVKMAGREVFKNAVRSMSESADFALKLAGLRGEDVDLLVPHQANVRIIEATAKYANIPMDRVFVNVDPIREHELRHHPRRPGRGRRAGAAARGDEHAHGGVRCRFHVGCHGDALVGAL